MTESTEIPGARVAVCGSTRCRFNENLQCTAETVVIGKGGDCKSETWVEGKK